MRRSLLVVLSLLFALPSGARAHRASDSYLALSHTADLALSGHWDVALSDLSYALGLAASDGVLTWGELRRHEGDSARLLRSGLRFETERGACPLSLGALALVELSDGPYARLSFTLRCPEAASARLFTSLLAEVDRDHRTFLRLGEGERAVTHVLGIRKPSLLLPLDRAARARPSFLRMFAQQIGRGLVHIFEGADHIAFLLVLLLPALFRRPLVSSPSRAPLATLLIEIAKVVTAFTAAHSLTLSLAALGFVRTSADVIEPAIAASVALAALSNLWPPLAQEGFVLAFALGLLHGFGFSSALSDAGLSGSALLAALLGFNLGVELGQLAIVALFVPLALLSCRVRWCRSYALPCGSAAVLVLALLWVFERLQTG